MMLLNTAATISGILGGIMILLVFAGWIAKHYIADLLAGVKRVDRKTATLESNGGSSMADKLNQVARTQVEISKKLDRHIEWHLNQR